MVTTSSRLAVVLAVLSLSACALSPAQKKFAGFAAGVLIVGAIAAHDADNGKAAASLAISDPSMPCRPQPDGGCR